MSRPGIGNQRAVVRHAVLRLGLRRRHLVVAAERQLLVDDVEDRVGAPVGEVRRAAARPRAAAPFIREDDLGAVVVERGRVPVGEILVARRVEALRVGRIRNVHQDAVARAGAGRQADFREHRDVVALIGGGAALRAGAAVAAGIQARNGAGLLVRENARAIDDARLLGGAERHFDHVDAEERRVRVLLRIAARAVDQLLAGADAAGAGPVDIQRLLVLRHQRVGVRAAAGLHRRDLLRLGDVGDVEDAHAAEAFLADRLLHALDAAVDAAAGLFDRHEQQVAVDRDVALAAGADHRRQQARALRALDVVGVEAVEVADHHPLAAEGDVGVREVQSAGARRRRRIRRVRLRAAGCRRAAACLRCCRWRCRRRGIGGTLARHRQAGRVLRIVEAFGARPRRDQFHAARGDAGVAQAGLQADARIVGISRLLLRVAARSMRARATAAIERNPQSSDQPIFIS